MNAYAPLFCNVNPGGMQWSINLIGYDALGSFGSPAYFVQRMFSNNRGNVVLPAALDPLPMLTAEPVAMNSVTEPNRVAPKPITIGNAGSRFTHELPAHSVTMIRLKTR
jgi:alpha-N-arabinofuranosidase